MALFEVPASKAAAPAARGRRDTNAPAATVWLNIGYEANGRFVSLPIGVPLDTMQMADETGSNPDWVNFRKAQNGLLKWLLGQASTLDAGGTETIDGLSLQVRKVGAPLSDEALGENPYAIDFVTSPRQAPASNELIPR